MAAMKRIFHIAALLALAGCAAGEPASQGHWQLSADYISSTMTLSNAVIEEGTRSGQFVPQAASDLPQGVCQRYTKMASRMHLRPPPAIYLDTGDPRPVPQSAARFSREGTPYVLINMSALTLWSPGELAAVLGHELAHLKERHVTPERLAEAYNRPELSIAHELEADRIGAGPLGSCDPQALEAALQIVIDMGRRNLMGGVASGSDEAADLPAGLHPSWADRKAALDAMIANPPEECAGPR